MTRHYGDKLDGHPVEPEARSTIHRHGDGDANQCAADQHYQQLDNHNQASPALEPALPKKCTELHINSIWNEASQRE